MTVKVIYHNHCPDGMGAALAAWIKFGDTAEYFPASYGDLPPSVTQSDEVYILDFSYSRSVLGDMREQCASLVVLDHHKTAMADLAGFENAIFDMNRSGCMIAWEYFHPGKPIPDLFRYLQDRDLWQKKLPQTEEVFAAVQGKNALGRSLYPKHNFEAWVGLLTTPIHVIAAIGQPLYAKRQKEIKAMADRAIWVKFAGYTVPCSRAQFAYSDVANLLCRRYPQAPFAICWRIQDGVRRLDFRSIGEFDVSVVAKSVGGGGHKNASGAQEELSWLEKFIH